MDQHRYVIPSIPDRDGSPHWPGLMEMLPVEKLRSIPWCKTHDAQIKPEILLYDDKCWFWLGGRRRPDDICVPGVVWEVIDDG